MQTHVSNQFKYHDRPNVRRLFKARVNNLSFPLYSFTVSRMLGLKLFSWLSAISTFTSRGVQHTRWEGNENSLKSRYSLNEFTRSTKHPKYILNKTTMLVDYASRGRSVFAYNETQCL